MRVTTNNNRRKGSLLEDKKKENEGEYKIIEREWTEKLNTSKKHEFLLFIFLFITKNAK